ncbi:MAG: hypothetical protein ABGZ35_04850 [Planctomycetaceae bacterium]
MRTKQLWSLACLLGCMSGCYQISDSIDDFAMCIRDDVAAGSAWSRWRPYYEDVEQPSSFGAGFRDGYESVAAGGNGCQPAMPPHKYWSIWYQNESGKARIHAWFNGFSHGALAAQQDDIIELSRIPIAPTIESQHVPNGAEHQITITPEPDENLPPEPEAAPPAEATSTPATEPAVEPKPSPETSNPEKKSN